MSKGGRDRHAGKTLGDGVDPEAVTICVPGPA
jgi:hypothetical protein